MAPARRRKMQSREREWGAGANAQQAVGEVAQ